MKIFFPIGAFYPSQVGGPCNTVYWHTCALAGNDIEVRIVTTDQGIPNEYIQKDVEIQNECGKIIYFENKRIPFKAFTKIRECIKWADIIHLNSLFHIFSIYSVLYIKLFHSKKKILWSTRGELNPSALTFSSWKKKLVLPIYQKFNKNITFHGTSNNEIESINIVFPTSKTIQLPNYLQTKRRLRLTQKNQLLFMGRIHPIKAIHKLINAVSLSTVFLNEQYKLVIAGDVNERQLQYYNELIKLISKLELSNIVEFRGHVTGEEKEILYAESYALVLPSESENFGNVVVEALNQGTPVIASSGTPWEVLNKYKCGFHVSNEPSSLAKSIDIALNLSERKYLNMRENAIKLVDQKFNIDTQIDKWIDAYGKLL